jgi:integrase
MASLERLPSGKYRAVISKYYAKSNTKCKQVKKKVSLFTESRGVADMRMKEVERYADEIFAGNKIEWSWCSNKTSTDVKYTKLKDAFKDFMVFQEYRKKVSISQRNTNESSFKVLLEVDGNILVRDLSEKILDKLCEAIDTLKKKNGDGYKENSKNQIRKNNNTFFKFLLDRKYIDIALKLSIATVTDAEDVYITESEFNSIVGYKDLKVRYARAFTMYRDTGLRLSEPFYGTLDNNNYLLIPANKSKGKRAFTRELTQEQVDTIRMMQKHYKENETIHRIKQYSKTFKRVCKRLNINESKHLHCLRHSFAVIDLFRHNDIYRTSRLLGHSKISTTEQKYLRFQYAPSRIYGDFPTLLKQAKNEHIPTKYIPTKIGVDGNTPKYEA